jgi:translocation and assembly module TamA
MKKIISVILICSVQGMLLAHAAQQPVLKFQIQGVTGELLQNVQSRLAVERTDLDSELNASTIQAFSHVSEKAVSQALAPFGFYNALVTAKIQHTENEWIIIYTIQPGLPVRITKVDIQISGAGADNKKINRFVAKFPLKSGDVFNSNVYSNARDKLFDVVSNEGYIRAVTGDSKVYVNSETRTAVIKLNVKTNERYYFGKVHFNKTAYDPEFLQRFDVFAPDQPFSTDKLLEYQQDMNNSRFFKQVVVIPDFDGQGTYVPINASVVPVNNRRYDLGLGYGTFTGPRLTAGVNFRRLTETGQSFDAQLKLSTVLSGVAFKYYIPGHNPLTDQWILGLNYQKFVPKSGSSQSKLLTFGYSKKMRHWQLSSNINYLWERYTVNSTPSRISQLLYPSLNIAYLKTDNVVQPTYGHSFNFMLQGASSSMLSTTSFLQGELKVKWFTSPFSFAHLILRGDVGYTVVNDLTDLPLSMRFFAGGTTSIRGFPDSSIGPGKYLGIASIEYRNHIAYDISGAVFYDVGTATNHYGTQLNRGVGVGLVYESIVGPIKLYVARAVSKRGQPYQIEFSMGPEF